MYPIARKEAVKNPIQVPRCMPVYKNELTSVLPQSEETDYLLEAST